MKVGTRESPALSGSACFSWPRVERLYRQWGIILLQWLGGKEKEIGRLWAFSPWCGSVSHSLDYCYWGLLSEDCFLWHTVFSCFCFKQYAMFLCKLRSKKKVGLFVLQWNSLHSPLFVAVGRSNLSTVWPYTIYSPAAM